MIVIRFKDAETEKQALGFLAGRCTFTTLDTGEAIVPHDALSALAAQGYRYSVEGRATYGQAVSALRGVAAAEEQVPRLAQLRFS